MSCFKESSVISAEVFTIQNPVLTVLAVSASSGTEQQLPDNLILSDAWQHMLYQSGRMQGSCLFEDRVIYLGAVIGLV